MPDQFKRGQLSLDERAYIKEHADKNTAEEIAAALGKTAAPIRRYIIEHCNKAPVGDDMDADDLIFYQIKAEFKKSPEWQYLREEFEPEEVRYFEHRYVKHVQQFKDDITPTEETQIFNLIKFEIMMHRNRKRAIKSSEDMDRLHKAIDKIYKTCNGDLTQLTDNQRNFLENMENHLSSYRQAQHASVKELTELQTKHGGIMKDLKATRDQRVSRIESNKQTFVELLKDLELSEIREREGRQNELFKVAAQKEIERLGQSHTFADGTVDQPLLNCDTAI